MATRLYPRTDNVALVEFFAGVPAGTQARLDAFEASYVAPEGSPDPAFAKYCARAADADLGHLDAFLTYGWGRTSPPEGTDPHAGESCDPVVVAHFAAHHGLSAPVLARLLECGVAWG